MSDLNVGDLVLINWATIPGSWKREGKEVGLIIKVHTYEYTTSDSVTEYHNTKISYDILWQDNGFVEELEEHEVEKLMDESLMGTMGAMKELIDAFPPKWKK